LKAVARLAEVTQGFGSRVVLPGTSLDITRGVQGLLGPNGAGKTTLLRTLATVLPPRSGRVEFDGEALTTPRKVRSARTSIGYLPQTFGFFPRFTVRDFVRYCAWLRGVPASAAPGATDLAIDRVGLSQRKDSTLRTLSGGMLRRVGIAQAIVGNPRLLLLDEPTVGLDPEQRLEFRELIREVVAENPELAVILSTHLVEDVTMLCSRVVVLSGGSVTFEGTPNELAARARPGARGDSAIERGYLACLEGSREE
jgi:ABC-2 type transport system ATP-binding protein